VALVFRPSEPADRPAILSLFRAAFKADTDPRDWAWKYDANPRRAVSVVAVDGGRLVGFFGAMGTRYRGAGGDLPGTSAVDVMTDPQARSLGKTALFKELGDAFRAVNAEAGIPFDFGFIWEDMAYKNGPLISPRLVREFMERLLDDDQADPEAAAEAHDAAEAVVEAPLRLDDVRREAVVQALVDSGAARVLDLGCGEGKLLSRLLKLKQFEQIVGLDVSAAALAIAGRR